MSGESYWATPGGGLEPNESFEQAAMRELQEETGLTVGSVGQQVASRNFTMMLPSGETVVADERFFIIPTEIVDIDNLGWTANEKEVIGNHHWWTIEELKHSDETIFPRELLIDILGKL
ncbi:8-oxo-dGTP pyrophosphatase MutT (NUDIX family) [Ewingella americana]